MIRHSKRRASAVGVSPGHGNVVAFSDQNETEPFEGSDDVVNWSVDGEFGHLCGQLSLGDKRLDNWFPSVDDFGAETLDMELDGRPNVG